MLKKAGCEDLVVYSRDNHPQLKDVDDVRKWYHPDIAIYPTAPEAVKAYELIGKAVAIKAHSELEDLPRSMARVAWCWTELLVEVKRDSEG